MCIIKLNRKHIEKLATIDYESEHQKSTNSVSKKEMKKEILTRFDKGHELFFGYKQNNELVGYITMKLFFPGHNHCEVYWLAVKKKFQRQKIGTALLDYVEKYAKNKKFRKLCLYTGKQMERTRKFYEKNGYVLINEFRDYYGYEKENTAVLYAKSL